MAQHAGVADPDPNPAGSGYLVDSRSDRVNKEQGNNCNPSFYRFRKAAKISFFSCPAPRGTPPPPLELIGHIFWGILY